MVKSFPTISLFLHEKIDAKHDKDRTIDVQFELTNFSISVDQNRTEAKRDVHRVQKGRDRSDFDLRTEYSFVKII